MPLTPDQIHEATNAPLDHVRQLWPLVQEALDEFGIRSDLVEVAAAATIMVETGVFWPIPERHANKDRQPALWALQERYWPFGFYGRGLIQFTWRSNYQRLGTFLGLDLLSNPDLLLDPQVSARSLAWFFRDRGVDKAANASNWIATRRLVNGGVMGWPIYNHYVSGLLEAIDG